MRIAVVVTHAADFSAVRTCVASVHAAGGIDEIYVVANGSEPPTFAGAFVMSVPNRGYGAAANAGFRAALGAGAHQIVLLNDDIVARPGWIEPLSAALVADVGAAQPKLLLAGTDPALVNSLGVTFGRDGAGVDIGFGTPDTGTTGDSDLACFTGGAVLFSAEYLRATGGFDERYFLYYEDADLAARGARLGWRYRLVTDAVVEHVVGSTTGAVPRRSLYLQERNRVLHAVRFADRATIAGALWLSVRRLRHPPRSVHLAALLAASVGIPGAMWRRARRTLVVGALGDAGSIMRR